MIGIARWHTLLGLCFALLGMLLGIYMAASHDHSQHVTHAHILLLGLVVSVLYATVYRLWIPHGPPGLALLQLVLHQLGTLVLVVCLFLLYAQVLAEATLGPILGVASVATLLGAALMLWMFVRASGAVIARADQRSVSTQQPLGQ